MPDAGKTIHVRQFKSELLIIVRLRSKSGRRKPREGVVMRTLS